TPSLNQGVFIEETISSVLNQTYPHIEYIILDAGSTDATQSILEKYHSRIAHVICEPDGGQADAINRGFSLATGEIIAWLNADDVLLPEAVAQVVRYFQNTTDTHFVYGDAIAMNAGGRQFGRRVNVASCDHHALVNIGDFIVQPAAFWRRSVIDHVGVLDDSLNYTLDYEFWMRVSGTFQMDYLPFPLALERLYGGTKTSIGGLERIEELALIAQQHGGVDVPIMFCPEAAATYMREALVCLFDGNRDEATQYYRRARDLNNNTIKFLMHFMVLLVWGGRGTMRLRLWSNLIRNYIITAPDRTSIDTFVDVKQPVP
ncbi:MAG: glycosyltransferase family 2 protein, partial [Chloroflexota bacterium]